MLTFQACPSCGTNLINSGAGQPPAWRINGDRSSRTFRRRITPIPKSTRIRWPHTSLSIQSWGPDGKAQADKILKWTEERLGNYNFGALFAKYFSLKRQNFAQTKFPAKGHHGAIPLAKVCLQSPQNTNLWLLDKRTALNASFQDQIQTDRQTLANISERSCFRQESRRHTRYSA